MYSVSSGYLDALKQKTYCDSVSGTVSLADGTEIEISDENIVKNSLKIKKELCGSEYRIGTFNLSVLSVTFFDSSAEIRDYTGAEAELFYTLECGGANERIPLGKYCVDGSAVKRRKNIVTLTAYDRGVFFDRVPSYGITQMTDTPYNVILAVCSQCGVNFATDENTLSKMPNSDTEISPKSPQLQSCRDIVMWCAQLLCGYAVINRDGQLEIIPAKYGVSESDPQNITENRRITEKERKSIYVTDTRAYIKYLSAYSGKEVRNYVSDYAADDEQASPAAYSMRSNPLLASKSVQECDEINNAWLSYIDGFKQRGVSAEIYGDPAIDIGDTIRFSGGDIDQRRSIVGLVTSYEWKYRSGGSITCTAAQCVDKLPAASSGGTGVSAGIKSQTEKRIDSVLGAGESLGNGNERFNDYSENNIRSGAFNHVGGHANEIQGGSSNYLGGQRNVLVGNSNFCTGFDNRTAGQANIACGISNTLDSAENCIVAGRENTMASHDSIAVGIGLTANSTQAVFGKFNEYDTGSVFGSNYALIVGGGYSGSPLNILTLDWEGNLSISGKLTSSGGASGPGGGKEYKSGAGITISADDVIMVNAAAKNAFGGITLGKGLALNEISSVTDVDTGRGITINADSGKVEADIGRGLCFAEETEKLEAAVGNGLGFDDDGTITLSSATDSSIGGIILGDGLELDEKTGKVNVTGGEKFVVEKAVILSEDQAEYIFHEYNEISYVSGQRAVYGTLQKKIIVQGYPAVSDQITVNTSAPTMDELFPETKPYWTTAFSLNVGNSSTGAVTPYLVEMHIKTISSGGVYSAYARYSADGGATWNEPSSTSFYSHPYIYLRWTSVNSPTAKFPNGYAMGQVFYFGKASSGRWYNSSANGLSSIILPFSSMAEYDAAAVLKYEPVIKYSVSETKTQTV